MRLLLASTGSSQSRGMQCLPLYKHGIFLRDGRASSHKERQKQRPWPRRGCLVGQLGENREPRVTGPLSQGRRTMGGGLQGVQVPVRSCDPGAVAAGRQVVGRAVGYGWAICPAFRGSTQWPFHAVTVGTGLPLGRGVLIHPPSGGSLGCFCVIHSELPRGPRQVGWAGGRGSEGRAPSCRCRWEVAMERGRFTEPERPGLSLPPGGRQVLGRESRTSLGSRPLPPRDSSLAPSGQVRVLQPGRECEGPHCREDDRGRRAGWDSEAWGHDHRADIREHRWVLNKPGGPLAWGDLLPRALASFLAASSAPGVQEPASLPSCHPGLRR